jgi:anti-sigma regulatory factor (Ser/Thr protein kinase)
MEKATQVKTFDADIDCLEAVQEFVLDSMQRAGFAHDFIANVELAVEEVFVNIALYAYKESEAGGKVVVHCHAEPKTVSLEFTDVGVPFNPLEHKDPDVSLGAEERELGGLGIFLVKKIMNVVEYRRENGKNVLFMSKRSIEKAGEKATAT